MDGSGRGRADLVKYKNFSAKVVTFVEMKRSFADILAGLDSDRARKVVSKLPEWAAAGAEIPSALALEQCSSAATARYKAALAASCGAEAGMKVLDLTGGLGVDSRAFSQVAGRVVYYERNAELAAAAERNFARLGAGNIEVRCETVTPDTELPEADLIYADPARRDAAGRKVFLLEDCTPDILTLLPMLLRKAPAVLLKLSPMADLTMLAERLGPALREIHVVESGGEVKELLCLLSAERSSAEPEIVVVRLSGQAAAAAPPAPDTVLSFRLSEEREAEAAYAAGVESGDVLLEPCPALLKAGAFRLPCARWGFLKLAPSTHLYLLPGANLASSAPGIICDEATPWFKARRICDVLPFGAAAFKELKRRCPKAEITARNLPLGSDALRKKMGIAPGGDTHIFGCALADGSAVLIVT